VILLDTDHLTVLKYTDSERHARLHSRLLAAAPEPIGTTIVSVQEQMRGRLSAIAKERTLMRQINAQSWVATLGVPSLGCLVSRSAAAWNSPRATIE
jgi:hypothetical protein